ncbi:uncharacterized protein LOC121731894 [Aricia agestis]|uniref:uncharacterized protein LOC121731894 n=1 Tax=Aricia agestis TaxID=91739 RepID=UPI001C204387|nr:uncharacterized protein LOC121731894 [Aricia agestis]
MAESQANSISWKQGFSDSTADPNLSMSISEEAPTLAVTTICGVTIVILLAIVAVFVLGILIDCRQQRLTESKQKEIRRLKVKKPHPRVEDGITIADNMEEPDMSIPPSEVIRQIP